MKILPINLAVLAVSFAVSIATVHSHGGHEDANAIERLESDSEFKRLSRIQQQRPADLANATKLARLCLEEGRPVQACEVLATWWGLEAVPQDLMLLRATILQREHFFDAALLQLDQLLAQNPKHAGAWLMKSTIHAVCGEYEQAYAAALPLFGLASPVVASTAAANALSLSGKAKESYALLEAKLDGDIGESSAVAAWALTTLAEMAVRLGYNDEARLHFERALVAQADNHYTRASYGEFLFQVGDMKRAWNLLRNSAEGEAEKLVLALIEKRSSRFGSRFAAELATAYRKIEPESRAAARYYLDVAEDPQRAWLIAKANWDAKQREPSDTLLALRAADAAGEDASGIIAWQRQKKTEDVRWP